MYIYLHHRLEKKVFFFGITDCLQRAEQRFIILLKWKIYNNKSTVHLSPLEHNIWRLLMSVKRKKDNFAVYILYSFSIMDKITKLLFYFFFISYERRFCFIYIVFWWFTALCLFSTLYWLSIRHVHIYECTRACVCTVVPALFDHASKSIRCDIYRQSKSFLYVRVAREDKSPALIHIMYTDTHFGY